MSFHTKIFSALAYVAVSWFLTGRPIQAQTSPSGAEKENANSYVGVEVCQSCHEDTYNRFAKSVHAETLKNKSASMRGCESCHGPGAEHVEAGGAPEKIWRYAGAKRETVIERCTRCHQTELGRAHARANLGCFTCHSIHHATQQKALLLKPTLQLCRGCHPQK